MHKILTWQILFNLLQLVEDFYTINGTKMLHCLKQVKCLCTIC